MCIVLYTFKHDLQGVSLKLRRPKSGDSPIFRGSRWGLYFSNSSKNPKSSWIQQLMVWHPQDASPSAAKSRMKTATAAGRLILEHQTPSEPLVWGTPPLVKRTAGYDWLTTEVITGMMQSRGFSETIYINKE